MSYLLCHRRARCRALERRLAGQHLVDHARQAVDVTRNSYALLAGRLLGAHVLGRSQRQTVEGQRLSFLGGLDVRDAEVRQQGMVVGEENILRLDVAVHETIAVRIVEPGTNLMRDAKRVVDGEPLLAIQSVSQRAAGNERRHIVQRAAGFAGVDERNDVRMRQARSDADLAQESLLADRGAELLPQNLYRNLAPVLPLLGQMNGGHATRAEESFYRVAIGERCLESERRFADVTRLEPWTLWHSRDLRC